MSDQKDDGGYAFPPSFGPAGDVGVGMFLRDWFAGQVVSSIMTDGRVQSYSHAAMEAYKMADAMLEARRAYLIALGLLPSEAALNTPEIFGLM